MRVDDLPLRDRLLLKAYQWRAVKPVPCPRLRGALETSRVGLVTTAGLVAPGQAPFDLSVRGGDVSYRVLSAGVDLRTLTVVHRSGALDRAALEQDRNVALPLDRLRDLAASGVIGRVAPRHLSFMRSIAAPGRLRKETAPQAAEIFVEDQVDVALLVPV